MTNNPLLSSPSAHIHAHTPAQPWNMQKEYPFTVFTLKLVFIIPTFLCFLGSCWEASQIKSGPALRSSSKGSESGSASRNCWCSSRCHCRYRRFSEAAAHNPPGQMSWSVFLLSKDCSRSLFLCFLWRALDGSGLQSDQVPDSAQRRGGVSKTVLPQSSFNLLLVNSIHQVKHCYFTLLISLLFKPASCFLHEHHWLIIFTVCRVTKVPTDFEVSKLVYQHTKKIPIVQTWEKQAN